MSWFDGAWYRMRTLVAPRRHDRDVEEEMRFHLELDAMHEGDRYRARRRFGNATYYQEEIRRLGLRGRLDAIEQDMRYAWRAIVRTPALSVTIVVTLALGIGVNVALFSLLDRLLLRAPAGVTDPDNVLRLYQIRNQTLMGERWVSSTFNHKAFLAMRDAIGDAAAVAPFAGTWRVRIGREGNSRPVNVTFAGPDYFALLGVRPALGRFFAPDESGFDNPPRLVIVSHRFWRGQLGGDSSVAGRTLEIEKQRFTIVGVAPADFTGVDVDATDIWLPFGTSLRVGEQAPYMTEHSWAIFPLVRPRSRVEERRIAIAATTALRALERDAARGDTTVTVTAGSLIAARGPVKKQQEVSIAIRLAAVAGVVLLIACANVANLLLARAVSRRREIAVRLALGISRSRLVSLLLSESVLLAVISGGVALIVGVWAGNALRALLMPDVSWAYPTFDRRLAAFAGASAVAAGILAGLAPAWRASRADLSTALKSGVREGTLQRSRLRTGLVVLQAALSVVLLVTAGLFVRSLQQVRGLDIGYDTDRVTFVAAYFNEGPSRWSEGVRRLAAQVPLIAKRLAAVPGVEAVTVTSLAPFWGMSFQDLYVPGGKPIPQLKSGGPSYTAISPGSFGALGLRVLRGRDFRTEDREGAQPVMVVNETMARTVWPGASALGKCIHLRSVIDPCVVVVGVVENARRGELIEGPTMQYYLPHAQVTWEHPSVTLVVRAHPRHAAGIAAAARRELRAGLPGAEISIQRMDEIVGRQMRPWRMGATLFLAFGLLALIVAAIGVYSTTSYTVGQRTHELGIRRALGAQAAHMLRLVLGAELRVVAMGIVAGVALSLAFGRFVESLLYEVEPRDPTVLGAVVVTLVGVAIIACLAPAMRAARVDPAVTLRAE